MKYSSDGVNDLTALTATLADPLDPYNELLLRRHHVFERWFLHGLRLRPNQFCAGTGRPDTHDARLDRGWIEKVPVIHENPVLI